MMLAMNETIDQLAITNSALALSCVEDEGWSCLWKGIGVRSSKVES